MKNFLILLLAFSTFISAEEYEFEPEPNKAEYYSGKFNKGKDMQDLLSWGEKFADWTNARSEWDTMRTVVFTPYYSDNLQRVDYVWLNLWPSAGKQYKAIEQWIKDGGKLASTLPVTNERVTDVWQWAISSPEGEMGELGFVRFTQCTLKEGVTMRKAFDAYKKFAIKARSTGDNMGRKMMMAPVGAGTFDYDYVYSLYANSPSEYGNNVDNYNENLWDTDEANALDGISTCENGRIYSTVLVKEEK